MDLVRSIDAILPQTQCTRCGFQGCLPYAQAIAKGTPHNQCPPGGKRVIQELSDLLNRPLLPLNPNHGIEAPKQFAFVREIDCVGCTKCLEACPTDAIVGSGKMLHTVIQEDCTGCGLCVPPCPTDCIELHFASEAHQPEKMPVSQRQLNSNHYRQKHETKKARISKLQGLKLPSTSATMPTQEDRKQVIQAILSRTRQ